MGDVIVFPADEERPVEVYEHRQVFVGFLELKPLAEVMTDERKCAVCGWWAWEGRHTSPCRDGADCGEPAAHHAFQATPLPERHLVLPTEDDK
jgi:hypothetical protein